MAKILVVDDEDAIRDVLILAFSSFGHTAEGAKNGKLGLEKVISSQGDGQFDLIITDNDMPIMSGNELAAKVRELALQIPLVRISGFDAFNPAPEGLFDATLEKPVRLAKMMETIEPFLPKQPKEKDGIHILILDDEKISGEKLAAEFRSSGISVTLAEDPIRALEILDNLEKKPDAIVFHSKTLSLMNDSRSHILDDVCKLQEQAKAPLFGLLKTENPRAEAWETCAWPFDNFLRRSSTGLGTIQDQLRNFLDAIKLRKGSNADARKIVSANTAENQIPISGKIKAVAR